MKKFIFSLIAISMVSMSTMSMAAMSTSKVRQETRFLTDKMAYELNLTTEQYNDVYEINYDFIYNVRYIMDDVVYGDEDALDEYYYYLDIRNDDLRWVLSDWQYERFMNIDYFYRPIYSSGYSWGFRVYLTYTDPYFFYFGRPYHYKSYNGGHFRTHFNNHSFYMNRYSHNVYRGKFQTRDEKVYLNNRRSDFGKSSPVYRNMNTTPNRESNRRGSNDELYNTERTSGSSRSRTSTDINRSSENRGTVRSSGNERDNVRKEGGNIRKEKENTGRDANKERTNTGGDRNKGRTPSNESNYYRNSDNGVINNSNSTERNSSSYRSTENVNRNSESGSSVSRERETPVRSSSVSRSSEYVRSSSESRPAVNVQRSAPESRPATPAPTTTRSSENERSSNVRSSSSEQSKPASNDNSRSSSESSRSGSSRSRR